MHVTSDYFRCRGGRSFEELGLVEHMKASADSKAEAPIKPLKPSRRTLRDLARRYKVRGTLRHRA